MIAGSEVICSNCNEKGDLCKCECINCGKSGHSEKDCTESAEAGAVSKKEEAKDEPKKREIPKKLTKRQSSYNFICYTLANFGKKLSKANLVPKDKKEDKK